MFVPTITPLFSKAANAARRSRREQYAAQGCPFEFVVLCETAKGFCEYDAESHAHALNLAYSGLEVAGYARTVSIRPVRTNGTLGNIVGPVYDQGDLADYKPVPVK